MAEVMSLNFDATKLFTALMKAPVAVARELRVEMSKSMRDVQNDARTHHRFKNAKGNLEKAIKSDVAQSGLEGRVFVDSGIAPYAAPVHDGSRPHIIRAKTRKALHFVSGGNEFFVSKKGYVNHPGTRPDKFVYEAMARQKQILLARMSGAVKRAFQIVGFNTK